MQMPDKNKTNTHCISNILATISDRKIGYGTTPGTQVSYWSPDIYSASDYYPFGWTMPGRESNGTEYRFGFNGKENDNEIIGTSNIEDYGFRMYNTRLGRFMSVDPLTRSYPELTPYQFASNTPIQAIDLDGLEAQVIINKISRIGNKMQILESATLTTELNYHSRFGNFLDYANPEKYGTRGTLVVNEFIDPVILPNGIKLNKYEYLNLSVTDKMKNKFSSLLQEGGTQKGGVSYTDGNEGGAMETIDQALSEDVEIVDIGSLLIYLNYSKKEISTNASTIRDIMDPEVMAETADLIADISELTIDKSIKTEKQEINIKNDSTFCAFCKINVLSSDTNKHNIRNEKP